MCQPDTRPLQDRRPPQRHSHHSPPGSAAEQEVSLVAAWPFRAQLLFLADAADLPWRAVALAAGLTPASIRALTRCRPRRGKLAGHQARALLALTPGLLRARTLTTADTDHVRWMVVELLGHGAAEIEIARFLRLSRPELSALLTAHSLQVTQRTELLALTAVQAAGLRCSWAPGSAGGGLHRTVAA